MAESKGKKRPSPLDAIKEDQKEAESRGQQFGVLEAKPCNQWIEENRMRPDPVSYCDGLVVEGENTVAFARSNIGKSIKCTQMAAEMIRMIGSSKLKVLYDVYHMQLNEGCIGDTIKAYADTFGHIHVADAPGRHEPGTGEINYAYVFKALEENGYEGRIGFELMPLTSTAEAVKAIMAID